MTARIPRPFEGVYGVSLLTAILALVPYIIVTSAYTLFRKQVAHDIGAGTTALEIINGLSTAGYAFGALLGGDLINRRGTRRARLSDLGARAADVARHRAERSRHALRSRRHRARPGRHCPAILGGG